MRPRLDDPNPTSLSIINYAQLAPLLADQWLQ
jgi:hypothetical protein